MGSGDHLGDLVYVATGDWLYRTADAGRTWTRIPVARLPRGFQ